MASASGFFTRFTPVECSLKAQSAIVAEAQVVGVATDELVLVRNLKGNMFQTVLRAKLEAAEDGTAIELSAGMDRIVFVFCCVFLAAFIGLTVMYLLAYLRVFQSFQFSDQDRKDWLFLSMPVMSMILGVGLVQLARYASRTEGPFLTRLILEATEAKPKRKTGPA